MPRQGRTRSHWRRKRAIVIIGFRILLNEYRLAGIRGGPGYTGCGQDRAHDRRAAGIIETCGRCTMEGDLLGYQPRAGRGARCVASVIHSRCRRVDRSRERRGIGAVIFDRRRTAKPQCDTGIRAAGRTRNIDRGRGIDGGLLRVRAVADDIKRNPGTGQGRYSPSAGPSLR